MPRQLVAYGGDRVENKRYKTKQNKNSESHILLTENEGIRKERKKEKTQLHTKISFDTKISI